MRDGHRIIHSLPTTRKVCIREDIEMKPLKLDTTAVVLGMTLLILSVPFAQAQLPNPGMEIDEHTAIVYPLSVDSFQI